MSEYFPALAIAAAALVLAMVAAYWLGREHGSPIYDAHLVRCDHEQSVTVEPVDVEVRIVTRGDVDRTMPADLTMLPELITEPDPVVVAAVQQAHDDREQLAGLVDEMSGRIVWLERTKKAALDRTAIERQRVRAILTAGWSSRRRAPKEQLVGEVIEIGDRQAPLVPPAIAREWDRA